MNHWLYNTDSWLNVLLLQVFYRLKWQLIYARFILLADAASKLNSIDNSLFITVSEVIEII